jgi:hypothetical protein
MTAPDHVSVYAPCDDLWIVTPYFNPCGYRSRRENYRAFAEQLRIAGLKLVTIECAFDDAAFELPSGPGVIQVRCRDILWQKERLFNLAVAALPAQARKVVCADGDILFENPAWAVETSRQLDVFPVVQPFARVIPLEPDGVAPGGAEPGQEGFACARGRRPGLPARGSYGHTGYAWAFRRELLVQHGLYDAAIVGGGDLLVTHAMLGAWDHRQVRGFFSDTMDDWSRRSLAGRMLRWGTKPLPGSMRNWVEASLVPGKTLEDFRSHYLHWAQGFHHEVQGRVGWVAGEVRHLWHGRSERRGRGLRYQGPKQANFAPATDLRYNADGCWEWASDKPALHGWVRDYFSGRQEDQS